MDIGKRINQMIHYIIKEIMLMVKDMAYWKSITEMVSYGLNNIFIYKELNK